MLLVALSVCVFACSKSSSPTPTAPVLRGDWSFKSEEIKGYFLTLPVLDSTVQPSAGDYADFSTSNILYSQITGIKDTTAYNLIGSSSVSFNFQGTLDTFAIHSLTQSSVMLTYTSPSVDTTVDGISGSGYAVVNINLTR